MITVGVVNQSSQITREQALEAIGALQIQVSRDFAPVWGQNCTLQLFDDATKVPSGAWLLALLDDSDQADALGYHDFTSSGQPIGKVFVKTTVDDGASWTVCASHELLEMLADPDIVRCVFLPSDQPGDQGILYAYEVCDAVEDDSLGYGINNITVSDFVFPAWFDPQAGASQQLSFQHSVTAPLELAAGGYISYFRDPNSQGWEQKFADSRASSKAKFSPNARGHLHHRRASRWVGTKKQP